MAYCTVNGNLYDSGTITEIKVGQGTDLKIQATGTGSCQITGKLTSNGTEKILPMVKVAGGTFSVATTITDECIYDTDISNLYSVSVTNVSGFTKIYATIAEV